MTTNEGQPFGPNPEWKVDKVRNTATARTINVLLSVLPDPVEVSRDKVSEIGKIFGLPDGFIDDSEAYIAAQYTMTYGYNVELLNLYNPKRAVILGVAQSINHADRTSYQHSIKLLPKNFNYPIFMIHEEDNSLRFKYSEFPPIELFTSSPYGKIQSHVLGKNGVVYAVRNFYVFNAWGQGAKLEEIRGISRLEELEKLRESQEVNIPNFRNQIMRVNFVPSEEDSRVVQLTQEDYLRVNKILKDIDVGLYKYRR